MTAGTELYPEQLAELGAELDEVSEQEIEEGLKELEDLGLLARSPTPTSLHGFSVAQGLLTARDELRTATEALALVVQQRALATLAETDAKLTYEYAELDFRAKRYAEGVPGKNEAERKVHLDLAVADDEELGELRAAYEERHATRLRREADERAADIRHKALRVELAALGQLVAAS